MTLWNPYAISVLGQPIMGNAPPALRVMGGEATAAQKQAAQRALYRFAMHSRLSLVPNPREQGRLPDGSRYEITVIGPTTTMQLWPVGGRAPGKYAPGIGVSVLVPHLGGTRRYLFVLAFREGAWKVTTPRFFFGGAGLWCSSRDERNYWSWSRYGEPLYWAAYNADDQATPSFGTGATVGNGGAAYALGSSGEVAGRSHPEQGGMLTIGGRYVQPTRIYQGMPALGVHTTVAVDPDAFRDTPFVPARRTAGYTDATPVLPAGLAYGKSEQADMLRDHSQMCSPVAEIRYIFLDPGANDTADRLSQLALNYELQLRQVNGQTVPSVVQLATSTYVATPEQVSAAGGKWRYEREYLLGGPDHKEERTWRDSIGNDVLGAVTVYPTVTATERYTRAMAASGVVFRAYDWNDARIEFALTVDAQSRFTVDSQGVEMVEGIAFVDNLNYASGPAGMEVASAFVKESELPPLSDPELRYIGGHSHSSINGGASELTPRTVVIPPSTDTGELRHVISRLVSTPWGGVALEATDVGMTFSATTTRGPDGSRVRESHVVSAFGSAVKRLVRFVEPTLGIVAFVEARVQNMRTAGGTSSAWVAYETSESFVVLHRGAEVLREEVSPVTTSGFTVSNYIDSFLRGTITNRTSGRYGPVSASGNNSVPYQIWNSDDEVVGSAQESWSWNLQYSTGVWEKCDVVSDIPGFLDVGLLPSASAAVDFSLRFALDPGSGSGVVRVLKGNEQLAAWAITSDGARTDVAAVIGDKEGAPSSAGAIIENVVSV